MVFYPSHPCCLISLCIHPSCLLSPLLSLFSTSFPSFLFSPHITSACPPILSPFPPSPKHLHPRHCFHLTYLLANLMHICPLLHLTSTFLFISPLYPSLQSRDGQVYLWGDARLSPRRPAHPLLAAPDGPAHGSPRPAGHTLCHLPLQLHRPQACALLGSTTCFPRATAGLGGLHCQNGSGQWEQES